MNPFSKPRRHDEIEDREECDEDYSFVNFNPLRAIVVQRGAFNSMTLPSGSVT